MTLFYSGDIVWHISCFECVLFSSYITFHNERLPDELEFKSHMLLLRGKKNKNFTTLTNSFGNVYCYFWSEIVFHYTAR